MTDSTQYLSQPFGNGWSASGHSNGLYTLSAQLLRHPRGSYTLPNKSLNLTKPFGTHLAFARSAPNAFAG